MIQIYYKLTSENEWRSLDLEYNEYFEPREYDEHFDSEEEDDEYFKLLKDEDDETYFLIHGTAIYEEPHSYLNIDPSELEWLVLRKPVPNGEKCFRYQFLDGTNAFMIHTTWPNGTEEISHSVKIDDERTLVTNTIKDPDSSWATIKCSAKYSEDIGKETSFSGDKSDKTLSQFQYVR